MRTLIIIVSIFINCQYIQGQNSKNELAKEVFESNIYKEKEYPKFSKKIEVLENGGYKFGGKFLKIELGDKHLEKLFELGIFNPDIIFGEQTSGKTKKEIGLLTKNENAFYNLTRNDSLTICCFESLEELNPNPQKKRFKFWVFRIKIANPTEFYIEFFNPKATKETTIDEFLENSKMSFFYQGTLII